MMKALSRRAVDDHQLPQITTIGRENARAVQVRYRKPAAPGVFCSRELALPQRDGVASMRIGLLPALVAVLLIRESQGLLCR